MTAAVKPSGTRRRYSTYSTYCTSGFLGSARGWRQNANEAYWSNSNELGDFPEGT